MHSAFGDSRLLPVGPLLYRDELGGDLVAFQADSGGRIVRGFLGQAPMMTMERVPFSQSVMLHWILLGLGVLVFVWIRARRDRARSFAAGLARRAPTTCCRADGCSSRSALLDLVFLVAVVAIVGGSGGLLQGPLTALKVAFDAAGDRHALCVRARCTLRRGSGGRGAGTRMRASSLQRRDGGGVAVRLVADAVESARLADVAIGGAGDARQKTESAAIHSGAGKLHRRSTARMLTRCPKGAARVCASPRSAAAAITIGRPSGASKTDPENPMTSPPSATSRKRVPAIDHGGPGDASAMRRRSVVLST